MKINLEFVCPPKLLPLARQPMRYKGAYGGRGGAKSHFFADLGGLRCLQPGIRMVCIREVQKTIKDSVRQLMMDKIMARDLGKYFDPIESEIRGPGGSLITFRGMQSYNAESIKSLEGYDIAWIEEAQSLSQRSLDLLRPTIRNEGSEIWASWNPRYKTDPVDLFFRKNPPKDSMSVFINWDDNPWFPGVLRREKDHDYENDPDKAEHIWGGAYRVGDGNILARWMNKAEREGRIGICEYGGGPVFLSSDIGFRDTAAWWFWERCAGGFRVFDYVQGNGMDADDWIPELQDKLTQHSIVDYMIWLPHDAKVKTFQSKHSSMERFLLAFGAQRVGIVPVSRKADQIAAARHVIARCEFDAERCSDGIDGLRAWEFDYNEETNILSREPKHNWASHPSDAFAYGCQIAQEFVKNPAEKSEAEKLREHVEKAVTLDDLWSDHSGRRQQSRI